MQIPQTPPAPVTEIHPIALPGPAVVTASVPAAAAPTTPTVAAPIQPGFVSTGPAASPVLTASAAPAAAAPPPALASLATLRDIEQQRDPRLQVQVRLAKPALKIGKDALDLTVRSNQDGYVYLVLLGSDAKSFYVLFPNGLDGANRIKAGQAMQLPRPDWQIKAAGPSGTNHLLVMVSKTPRQLDPGTLAAPSAAQPFTYALNDLGGRAALIDFLTGSGAGGRTQSFGARLVEVRELP